MLQPVSLMLVPPADSSSNSASAKTKTVLTGSTVVAGLPAAFAGTAKVCAERLCICVHSAYGLPAEQSLSRRRSTGTYAADSCLSRWRLV